MKREINRNKPMNGSVEVVGKDKRGNKIILPADSKMNAAMKMVSGRPINFARTRTKAMAKEICATNSEALNERISTAQATWRKNRRIAMGFKE